MRKIFSKLHLWLSVPFGIFISIVCLTGALLVFEEEINEMSRPELYKVENTGAQAMNPKALAALVAKTLPEDTQVTGVTISDDPTKTWKVSLSKPHHASVAVNPYTGEVLGRIERSEFFNQVMALHRYLFVKPAQRGDMTVGKFIVGASVLVMVFVLITGLVVWFPRKGQSWGSRFAISVKGGSRKFWYQLHNNGGMYVCLFLLLMALTGLTWSFSWYRTGFYALFGGEEQQSEMKMGGRGEGRPEFKSEGRGEGRHGEGRPEGKPEGKPEFKHGENEKPLIEDSVKVSPEGRGEGRPEFKSEGRGEGRSEFKSEGREEGRPEGKPEFKRGEGRGENPNFHHEGGEKADFSSLSIKHDNEPTQGVRAWVYQLHTGKWGGMFSKILYFLACLVGATLPWTGYYFWLKKKK
jgi:uncharacterized iron-regulated membrane protein